MFGLEGCVLAAHVRILETYFFIPILLCPQGSGLFFIDVLYRLCYRGFGAMGQLILWVRVRGYFVKIHNGNGEQSNGSEGKNYQVSYCHDMRNKCLWGKFCGWHMKGEADLLNCIASQTWIWVKTRPIYWSFLFFPPPKKRPIDWSTIFLGRLL